MLKEVLKSVGKGVVKSVGKGPGFFKKFPRDYVFELDESRALRSKFSTLEHVGVETLSSEAVEPGGQAFRGNVSDLN